MSSVHFSVVIICFRISCRSKGTASCQEALIFRNLLFSSYSLSSRSYALSIIFSMARSPSSFSTYPIVLPLTACLAYSNSLCPVRKTVRQSGHSFSTILTRDRPSIPGMRISVIRRSTRIFRNCSNAPSAEGA